MAEKEQAAAAPTIAKLTAQDRNVLAALGEGFSPRTSAFCEWAGIRTSSPRETSSRHCIKLTKLGLAEKTGTRMFPDWRITDAGRAALASDDPLTKARASRQPDPARLRS